METTLRLWDTDFNITFAKANYANNNNLAIMVYGEEVGSGFSEPLASVTVNIANKKLPSNMAFIDTYNCPLEILCYLVEKKILTGTGHFEPSGFNYYELCSFEASWLNSLKNGV